MSSSAVANREAKAKRSEVERTITENLIAFAKERDVTPSDLSRGAGVTYAAAERWLSGESVISTQNVKPVCDFLGVPIHALLGEESSYTQHSAVELEALSLLGELGDEGQAKAIAYLEDLVATGKYGPVD